ncbi:MAG: ribonuclease PH [Clostridia bacterium]|nr:ribonuclease PH [Clostridia bacterium]
MRIDGRTPDQARPVTIQTNFVRTAAGSCLIATGNTRVICTAPVEESVPPFLRGKGQGWVTAEYAMLPASTSQRKKRDGVKKDGRSVEIQRLIGRSLRQAVDMEKLGERTITLDCDVLEADGGTRTASITGAFVALTLAVDKLLKEGKLLQSPIIHQVAAVSCGVVDDVPCLDLCYEEDSRAQVDMNLIMNEKGEFIELQGTGEGRAYTAEELSALIAYGREGIMGLQAAQIEALGTAARHIAPKPPLVVASGNEHKLRELQSIFGDYYTVVSMKAAGFYGMIDENADTFAGNAAIKAETVCEATGLPTLADDSGLAVDILDGEPGVMSARYAGNHGDDAANNALLLRRMNGKSVRSASFVCAIALKIPGKDTLIAEGACPGVILDEERGEGGFGYDPLFLYEPLNKTFAELTEEEKNQVSHRARACEKMLAIMKELHD